MAGSYFTPKTTLGSYIAQLQRQAENLATSPQAGYQSIREGGQVVLNGANEAQTLMGRYVWPTAPWTGNVIYGYVTFDGVGNPIVVMGLQPDGLYGVGIYSPSGSRVALLGKQPTTGAYGLSILNSAGVLQMVGGVVSTSASNVLAQSGTFASPQATGASVTTDLGPSKEALATWSCTIQNNPGSDPGFLELFVDGARLSPSRTISLSPGMQGSVSRNFVVTTSTTGSHTFSLSTWTASGGAFDCINPTIVVQPL